MNWVTITGPACARWSCVNDTHPWAAAWTALSPQRRAALHGSVVDREPVAALAARLGRTEDDTQALVSSTLLAFRREVVLGLGTGYDAECGSLVLRLVDSAGERLTRTERKALSAHADSCPACARAVGELLELDSRLRDGLLELVGADAPAVPRTVAVPAPRAAADDAWAPAFERLTAERRTALVHGAAGAEPVRDLAARLGTTEPAARQLAASSLLAFRQTVLRSMPVGTGEGCALVAEHRTDDVVLDASRERALKAHAAACTTCAPTVAEILALHESLRPRVATLALGAGAETWLKAAPRRSWVPGVERPADPQERRRRTVIGAGLAAAAVAAVALLGGTGSDPRPSDVTAADSPVVDATRGDTGAGDDSGTGSGRDRREQVVRAGARIAARTPVAVDAATAAPQPGTSPSSTSGPTTSGPGTGTQPGSPGGGPGGGPDGPGTPGGPDEDPDGPPLDVQVDSETGSITVTVGLLGDPIVISTPPLTKVNKR